MTEALVDEAMKKSSLVWIALPDGSRPRPAWHLWHGGAAYVLTGGEGEQPLPGLPEADRVTVITRSKDKGCRLVSWQASVEEVPSDGPEWEEVAPLLFKERLNARPQPGEEVDEGQSYSPVPRWARESYLMKLTPTGVYPESPGEYEEYAVVRPVPNPAVNATRRPFMLGAKRRKADL
jgi:hypothetical protein